MWVSVSGAEAVTVYRKVMPDGSVKFSDEPFPGSEEVNVDTDAPNEGNAIRAREKLRRDQHQHKLDDIKREAERPKLAYRSLSIVSPTPDQIIRSNGGMVSATASVDPVLAEGDEIVFYIDGQVAGRSSSTGAQLPGVANGRHQLSAAIVSNGKEVMRSQSVEFHLLRNARGGRAAPGGRSGASSGGSGSGSVAAKGSAKDGGITEKAKDATSGDKASGDKAADDTASVAASGSAEAGDGAGERRPRIEFGLRRFQPGKVEAFVPGKVEAFVPGKVQRLSKD